MLLFVGLGNPGPKYAKNRHNFGFMAADAIIRRHRFAAPRARFQGQICEGTIAGEKALVLMPATYMNESGRSVGEAMRFYKLSPDDVTVLHDELDLAPGKVRVKIGGGAGGHNGIRSIDSHIGRDYRRIRLGIGHPGDKDLVHNYVLQDFAKSDMGWVEKTVEAVADALPLLVGGGDSNFMTRVALLTQPPKPKRPKPDEAAADAETAPGSKAKDP